MDEDLGESLIRSCAVDGDDDEEGGLQMESKSWGSFYDLGDDVLALILSFLAPSDIAICSRVSHRLSKLCRDDHKVWYPMCERRFGSSTNIRDWGACGRVSYKVLLGILSHFENLVGFWRGVEYLRQGALVIFEWDTYRIVGYRVTPARQGSYKVCKLPFVAIGWIGVSHKERPVCLLDPDWAQLVPGLRDVGNSSNPVSGWTGEVRPSSQPLQIPVPNVSAAGKGAHFSSGRVSPFEALGPNWNLEQPTPAGLVVVDIHFVGNHHIVLEEYQQALFTGYPFTGKKTLVEAAALASFGSSENLCQAGGSPVRHSPASSGGGSDAGKSPPGSFPYEMYQYLAKKVTSPGGERAALKQKRRDRERAINQGKPHYVSEHFVKIPHLCPTREQPLQGLWKGIGCSTTLEFVLLSYDGQGGIICRRIGISSGIRCSSSICWTAKSGYGMSAPLPDIEKQNYELRQHIRPSSVDIKDQGIGSTIEGCIDEEVVEMLWATVDVEFGPNQGRVWQYASGRFGIGFVPDDLVVDFRPICIKENLADVVVLDIHSNCL